MFDAVQREKRTAIATKKDTAPASLSDEQWLDAVTAKKPIISKHTGADVASAAPKLQAPPAVDSWLDDIEKDV
jgi:hypothetical protein